MAQSVNTKFTSDSFELNLITGEVLYTDEKYIKKNITLNAVMVANYPELKKIANPKYNAVYILLDSKNVYAFTTNGWLQIFTHADIQKVITHLDDLTPAILTNADGEYIAPITTIGNVYDDTSRTPLSMSDILGEDHLLRVYKTESRYVEALVDNQRTFPIPYPYSGYDFTKSHMSIVLENRVLEPSKYIIQGDELILIPKDIVIAKGQSLLFIFFYTVSYDLNKNVVLGTSNLMNRCITTDKLSADISVKASHIVETPTRLFFTPEERAKLRGLNSKNYVHPETHPASMITETDDRKWLNPKNIDYWNKKANGEDVYTKKEVESKIYEILNTGDLSTFNKIAEALGKDPNFATTIISKLAEKASISDVEEVKKEVDKKVYLNDYIRGTVYDLANKYVSDGIDYYSIKLADSEFKEYVDGMSVTIKINETNEGPAMIRINDLPFKTIITSEHFKLIPGELKRESIYQLRYNGTTGNFILQGKGGVKITDTTLKEYTVGPDGKVMRGNPVDLNRVDMTINKSKVIIDPLINFTTKYKANNPKNLYCDYINTDTILITWLDGEKVFAKIYNIKNGYVAEEPENKEIIIQDKCSNYVISKVADNTYCAICAYKDTLTIKILPINNSMIEMEKVTGHIDHAYGEIINMYFNQCGINQFILAYNHSNVTETKLYSFSNEEKRLVEISKRNNIDYPIDVAQKINNNQILFLGNYLNSILGWVLTIDETDFFNSTTVKLALVNNDDNENIFKNIKLFPLVGDRALLNFELDGARCKKILSINGNGEITTSEHSIYTEDILERKHHNNINNRVYIPFIDSFISASNYDKTLDMMTSNPITVKLLLEREGNNGLFFTTYDNNQFLINEELITEYITVDQNHVLLTYFDSARVLKVVLAILIRKPDGIAQSDGDVREKCKIYRF